MWLFKLVLVLAVAYIAVVAVMYATQTQMLFPTRLATASGPLLPKRIANLKKFFFNLFPDYPDRGKGQEWTGLRPTTPDGIPYLGLTPIRGLYLNTGHGHLGWTMSCGSAKAVCDLIMDRVPEIDLAGMTLRER